MTPVIPCSVSNISFIPATAFTTRKNRCFARYNYCSGHPTKHSLPSQRFFITLPRTLTVFPQLHSGCASHHLSRIQKVCATGTDVAVEEQDSAVADEASAGPPQEVETNGEVSTQANVSATSRVKRRPGRKSEMPPVNKEDLVPGAVFTGKVRSIQPFGAFVDFGAFTDGLVHVSRLSDSFVKDVNDVVTLGQEVKVRLVEVNTETGRISLSMREADGSNRAQQRKDDVPGSDKPRPPRRNSKPTQPSKFVKGQDLVGTVKNLARSGAFISLPEGEEGFLPTSEEADEGFGNVMGESSLEVGQEVNVRVLKIARGTVSLTMKKEEDVAKLDSKLKQGTVHTATNPFFIAFRRNKDIAAFLDDREKPEEPAETSESLESTEEVEETIKQANSGSEASQVQDELETSVESSVSVSDAVNDLIDDKDGEEASTETSSGIDSEESSVSNIAESVDVAATIAGEETQVNSEIIDSEVQVPTPAAEDPMSDEVPAQISAASLAGEGETVNDTSSVNQEVVAKPETDDSSAKEEASTEVPANEAKVETSTPAGNGSLTSSSGGPDESSPQGSVSGAAISPALVKQLREETGAGMMDCKKALSETGGDIAKAQEYLRKKGLSSADKKASRATAEGRIGSYIHDSRIGVLIEVNCETDFVSRGDIFRELVDDLAMQVAACPQVEYLSTDDVPKEYVDRETELEMQKEDLLSKPEQIRAKIVEGRIKKRLGDLALLEQPYIKNDKMVVKDWVKQTIATIGENIKVTRFVKYNLGEGLEKKNQDFAAEVAAQTTAKAAATPEKVQPAAVEVEKPVEKAPAVAVSAALVKQLREESGAGMMDCKKALSETGGDLEKAQEYLRKKGLSAADKKSSRIAAEGRLGSYIHDARIGVLIEVNCETDFVGRSENFKELVEDLAMQVAACPRVQYVSIEDIPESITTKEKEIEMQREDIQSKPENIREKIVEGRISKRLGELALLEQPFIKNDSLLVKDLVKQTVAALGENIKVRRFTRFTLGEEAGKSETDSET